MESQSNVFLKNEGSHCSIFFLNLCGGHRSYPLCVIPGCKRTVAGVASHRGAFRLNTIALNAERGAERDIF